MGPFEYRIVQWSVRDVLKRIPQMRLNPDYQREGSIWSLSRRQLFLDSILNGFDSPKIYLHELVPPEFSDASLERFAVIDGRQRLESLQAFAKGEFRLASHFRLFSEGDDEEHQDDDQEELQGGPFAQMTLPGLRQSNETLARRFFAYQMTIVIVKSDDLSYIEEMFLRLNEGAPLNAAEKRNRGQLLRNAVNGIKTHSAFSRFSVLNRRSRHSDLAVRFLFFESSNATVEHVQDMRASTLNDFVEQFRPSTGTQFSTQQRLVVLDELDHLKVQVIGVLDIFDQVFLPEDHLLKLTGDILTFYVAFRSDPSLGQIENVRAAIGEFFTRADGLSGLDEDQLSADELAVMDYFSAIQGTTTGSYLAQRASLLRRYIRGDLTLRSTW